MLGLCEQHEIDFAERDVALAEAYVADEAFCTGTMGEIAPVTDIDGRSIGDGQPGQLTLRLSELFAALVASEGTPIV